MLIGKMALIGKIIVKIYSLQKQAKIIIISFCFNVKNYRFKLKRYKIHNKINKQSAQIQIHLR